MCLDLHVICAEVVRLIAGWLSSRMVVGLGCGNPRSDANWRKNRTSLAQRPRARYSASQGLRAMPAVSAEEWTTNGALTVPTWIV